MNDRSSEGRVMALDYGAKRTGVAISDETRTIVRPLDILPRANSSGGMDMLRALVVEQQVVGVVVGLPVGLDGSETKQTARCRSYAARVAQEVKVPVSMHDERFTSRLADITLAGSDTTASRDSLAACHLLTSWLEAQRP